MRLPHKTGILRPCLFGSWLLLAVAPAHAQPAETAEPKASARISQWLQKLTLPEKVDLIRGGEEPEESNQGQAGFLPGAPGEGIRSLRLADGPPGLLTRHPSIAEPATMAVAATFDTEIARENGVVIADEARRLGIDIVLQPFINMDRDITSTRGYNTFGEDPVLTGAMGAAEVIGIQSRGVMAQAKHFLAYDTDGLSVAVDPQTLHEVYLEPFAEAVRAGVSSIMCSYNRINGEWACGNEATLTGILRDELHFQGFVTSDWGAVHSNRQLAAGMDMEMPGVLHDDNPLAGVLPSYFDLSPAPHNLPKPRFDLMTKIFVGGVPEEPVNRPPDWEKAFPVNQSFTNLSDALKSGAATPQMVDRAAGRVLHEMDRFGLLAGSAHPVSPPQLAQAEIEAIVRRTSAESAVLLKNADGALPLSRDDLEGLAMIGPGAAQTVAVGKAGERSLGEVERQRSPFDVMRTVGSGVVLAVADDMTGSPIPAAEWRRGGGALVETTGAASRHVAEINFTRLDQAAFPPAGERHWKGRLKVASPGVYWFYLQILGARGSLFIDGRRIAGSQSFKGALHGDTVQPNQDSLLPTTDGLDNVRVAVALDTQPHDVEVAVEPDGSGDPQQVRLNWVTPATRAQQHAEAVSAASHAKKAVIFAWSRNAPAFRLPGDQDALIEDVAHANPNTVVVLNTSQPVALPWLDQVKAVLEMWWAGDQGGPATTDILLGRVSPAGRLPFTWGRSLEDYPATAPQHPERSSEGVGGVTTFSEGLNVGYRWFASQGVQPLFPFGFGLSYSRFGYSDLTTKKAPDGGFDLGFTLRNLGDKPADEVCQAYLGPPVPAPSGPKFAVEALAAFTRVHLAAHEIKQVALHIEPRRFEYWSTERRAWLTSPGARRLTIGGSSAEVRLTASLTSRLAHAAAPDPAKSQLGGPH